MPRNARVVIPDCPHHVTQRGNNRQDVFFTDGDREVYLGMPAEQCERFGLSVEGYCLMTNHVHLAATPRRADSPANAVGRTNLYYTRHVNALHGRSGHLWQDRFFSCPQDEEIVTRIRTWSNRGCPLGSDSFISKLETALNRRLRPANRGRPAKTKSPLNGNRPNELPVSHHSLLGTSWPARPGTWAS